MTTPPLRGKRGAERRLGETTSARLRRRATARGPTTAVDFDVAEVDREVEDVAAAPRRPTREARDRAADAAAHRPARAGRRLPDLSALPPLLAATGSFAALRERLGRPTRSARQHGRHAGLTSVPHGAKTLPRRGARARPATGERLVWIARDAEIGDRVAEELGAWLGDPDAVAVLEPRTALAYERSELVADETAARVAALAAWRSGRARILVASVQALLQRTLDPADLPRTPRVARAGRPDRARRPAPRAARPRLPADPRGRRSRRVRPTAAGSSTSSRPASSLPVRIDFFGDEIDSLRRFDPTDQRTRRPGRRARPSCRPASSSCPARRRRGAPRAPRPRRRSAARAAGRRPRPVRGQRRPGGRGVRRGTAGRHPGARRRRRRRGLGRRRLPGDRARPRRARHAPRPRRAGRHRRGRRVPVAPGRRAARRPRRGRRPAEGLAGDLPAAARLEGAAARRPDARADLGVRAPARRSPAAA